MVLHNKRQAYPECALGLELVCLDFAGHFGGVYLIKSKVRQNQFSYNKATVRLGRNIHLEERRTLRSQASAIQICVPNLISTTVSFVPTPHQRDHYFNTNFQLSQKCANGSNNYISFLFRPTRLWNFTNVPPYMSRELGRVSESHN